MFSNKQLEQNNEAGSTGYQAGGAMTVYGVSYTEARQIALDLWKANALELSQQAAQVALERANEFLDAFLNKLNSKNPKLLDSLNDPGMQWTLFSAQRDYARSGNEEVFELLVEILSSRAEQNSRNILQIVLDESIPVIPKLTEEHVDIITLVFIIKVAKINPGSELGTWNEFLHKYIEPFCENIKHTSSCINHLQYSNCITMGDDRGLNRKGPQFSALLQEMYPLFFMNGFNENEFVEKCGGISKYQESLFRPHVYDNSLLQFNYESKDAFYEIVRNCENNVPQADIQTMLKYVHEKTMNLEQIITVTEKSWHFISILNEYSPNYKLGSLQLTSVGIALAQANLKRRIGVFLPLSNWIK